MRQHTPLAELLNDFESTNADLTEKYYSTTVVNSAVILPTVIGNDPTPPTQEPKEAVEPEPPPDLSRICKKDVLVVMRLLNDVFNSFSIPIK